MAQVRNSWTNCILSSAKIVLGVVQLDPWLAPFKDALRHRYSKAQDWITALKQSEGGLEKFSRVSWVPFLVFDGHWPCPRAQRNLVSMLIKTTILFTENGHPMQHMHSLLVISVSSLLLVLHVNWAEANGMQMTGTVNHTQWRRIRSEYGRLWYLQRMENQPYRINRSSRYEKQNHYSDSEF